MFMCISLWQYFEVVQMWCEEDQVVFVGKCVFDNGLVDVEQVWSDVCFVFVYLEVWYFEYYLVGGVFGFFEYGGCNVGIGVVEVGDELVVIVVGYFGG